MVIRILFAQPVPSVITDWLKGRVLADKVWRGTHGANFQVLDLVLSEADGVLFRLMFPLVIFNKDEVKLTNEDTTEDNKATKSRLYDTKFDEYMKLYTEEEKEW